MSKVSRFDINAKRLWDIYSEKLRPIERAFLFNLQCSELHKADFFGKPLIMVLGQYSTGKTTFIKYVLDESYPGMMIGPEPTTDTFSFIVKGKKNSIIPGTTLALDNTKPFRFLNQFGQNFLLRSNGITLNNPLLDSICIVDTPGILAGEAQEHRGYDYKNVVKILATKTERIIVIFDTLKLNVSEELGLSLELLKDHKNKFTIVLNKADQVPPMSLINVYGALLWTLSKTLNTPEIVNIHVGSFWDHPLKYSNYRDYFEEERKSFFNSLQTIPSSATVRKIEYLIGRSKSLTIHALLLCSIKHNIGMFGGDKKKAKLVKNLHKIATNVSKKYGISDFEFPDIEKLKMHLNFIKKEELPSSRGHILKNISKIVLQDLKPILPTINEATGSKIDDAMKSSVFFNNSSLLDELLNKMNVEGEDDWIVAKKKLETDELFAKLNPNKGLVPKEAVKDEFVSTKLPETVFTKIWNLSKLENRQPYFDEWEFAIFWYLVDCKLNDQELPSKLPENMIPSDFYKQGEPGLYEATDAEDKTTYAGYTEY